MKQVTLDQGLVLRCIGEVLRRERLSSGLSQENLANQVGLHRTYIGSVERGERNITVGSLLKISQSLKIGLSDLISEAEALASKGNEANENSKHG